MPYETLLFEQKDGVAQITQKPLGNAPTEKGRRFRGKNLLIIFR